MKSDHKPKGEWFEVGGSKCYHSGSGEKYLMLMEDVWGATSCRHESVADTFADLGYNVYMPLCLEPAYVGDYDLPNLTGNEIFHSMRRNCPTYSFQSRTRLSWFPQHICYEG